MMGADPWGVPVRRSYQNGRGWMGRETIVYVRQWVATDALHALRCVCRAFASRITGEK